MLRRDKMAEPALGLTPTISVTHLPEGTMQRRVSRRGLIATLAASPLLIAACQALPDALRPPTPTPAEPRSLRVGWPSTAAIRTGLDLILLNLGSDFAPERHLRLESVRIDVGSAAWVPQLPSRYADAVKAMTPTNVPDLIVTDGDLLSPLARAGLLRDLGPLLQDQDWYKPNDFYGNGLQAGQVRGKQMALPFSALVEILLYNQSAFQTRGVAFPTNGWTWDQLLTTAKALTTPSSGSTAGRWGFSVTPDYPTFWTTAWQRGAQVVS